MRRQAFFSISGVVLAAAVTMGGALRADAAGAVEVKRPAITGLAFVRFYESDMAAAKHFYAGLLGLHETDAANGDASFAVGMRQRIEIAPMPAGDAGTADAKSRLAEVGFLTKDLTGMQRYLEAHGLRVEQVDADAIQVRDPEGNLTAFVGERRAAAEVNGRGSLTGGTRGTVLVAGGKPGAPTARRMIHAGWRVRSRATEDGFYREVLGFKPYWHGGMKPGTTDWVSLQVPEGTDWIEYMLQGGDHPDQHELGVLDHTSLGVEHMPDVTKQLIANGMADPQQRQTQIGKDGKWQLNVFDPDLSRIEFMEFKPVQAPCCSEFTGRHPAAGDAE